MVGYTPRGAARHVFSVRKANEREQTRIGPLVGSKLKQVDAHVMSAAEYDELPKLTDAMLARAVVKKGGRPYSANPRQLLSLRLPADVLARWKATGPGWQTRMAELLSRAA